MVYSVGLVVLNQAPGVVVEVVMVVVEVVELGMDCHFSLVIEQSYRL